MIYAGVIIAVLVFANWASRHGRKWWYRNDVQFPVPTVKRTDLLFGYYGCLDDQVAETKGHVNLLHESQFQGEAKAIENILSAGVTCCLDVSAQVFDKTTYPYKVHGAAELRLRGFFSVLRDTGALRFVKIIYPADEPNNTVAGIDELAKAISIIRNVAGLYLGDDGYKLAVIYAADKEFIGQGLYDYVGFDDYDKKSSILVSKQYKELVASLHPFQRTIIVPGGAYGQDPAPFVNYAQANAEVGIIMPFLWLDDKGGDVGQPGIRSNSTKAQYIAAGLSVI